MNISISSAKVYLVPPTVGQKAWIVLSLSIKTAHRTAPPKFFCKTLSPSQSKGNGNEYISDHSLLAVCESAEAPRIIVSFATKRSCMSVKPSASAVQACVLASGYHQIKMFLPGKDSIDKVRPCSSGKLKSFAFSPGMARRRTEARRRNPPVAQAMPNPTTKAPRPTPSLDAACKPLSCPRLFCKTTGLREGLVMKHVLHAAVAKHKPPPITFRRCCCGIARVNEFDRVLWHVVRDGSSPK